MKSRLNLRNLLAAAILVFAGILIVVAVRSFQGGRPEEILEHLPRNVDVALQQIHYTETRDGVRHWTLIADSAAHSVVEGLGDVVMTARSGRFDVSERVLEAAGDVVVRSPEGYAFHTETARYRDADRTIRTEAPVRIVSDTMEVKGRGMRYSLEDQTLTILSEVVAHLENGARR